jgi:hypothetical protein
MGTLVLLSLNLIARQPCGTRIVHPPGSRYVPDPLRAMTRVRINRGGALWRARRAVVRVAET